MAEWWTYRPSDFLMFSARTWARLLEGVNADAWPLQPVLLVAGLALVAVALRGRGVRWIAIVLAAGTAFVAGSFHWERFADINTAAPWFAGAWGVQALLLLALGGRRGDPPGAAARTLGLALALAALAYPLLSPALGRGWGAAEVVGLMPDPTALFTVGLLLASPMRHRAPLLVLPAAWLVVGWTTDVLLYA